MTYEFWWWLKLVGVVILTLTIIVAAMSLKYNCCLDAGFTMEQCTYSTFCNG